MSQQNPWPTMIEDHDREVVDVSRISRIDLVVTVEGREIVFDVLLDELERQPLSETSNAAAKKYALEILEIGARFRWHPK